MYIRTIAAAAALALLGPAAAAQAGPPGHWTKVTDEGTSLVAADLARTPDGRLHVLWPRDNAVLHSALSADAKALSGPDTVVTYSSDVNVSPALLASGGSLRALFSGSDGPVDELLATATSTDGGNTWSPAAAASNPAGAAYAAIGMSAALLPDGRPVSAWGSPGAALHIGLDPSDADGAFPGGALADPAIGVDAQTGQAVVAWNRVDEDGVAAMAVSPAGGQVVLPNSDATQLQHAVGVTGRIGAPGVYIGYTVGANPFTGKPAVIRFGSSRPVVLSKTRGARYMSIAAAPGGRLWAFWERDERIYARRSNPAATAWGATVSVKGAGGTIHELAGEGSAGPLDVLARTEADYHQRILPGLTVKAKHTKGDKVTLTVTDAGTVVPGATVSVKGAGARKTGKNGTALFTLPAGSRHTATARKEGYVGATTSARG